MATLSLIRYALAGYFTRSAVIVRPCWPYLMWARTNDADGLAQSVFEDLRSEPHTYLLPETKGPRSQQEVLSAFWRSMFDVMLEHWVTDEVLWPNDRTRAMFEDWFEIQMCSVAQDLCFDEPLKLV